jgi:hypothetical protein
MGFAQDDLDRAERGQGYLKEDFGEVFPRYISISEVRPLVRESEEVQAEKEARAAAGAGSN